ncbi:HAD-IIIA family hydrolase, partial [uncultured Parvibaculum sp.]|uniref:D-glycero-alpha-D-manno-heptose-1,7-bisphosphate 7-phosphatase n=1 Tax=uncultured Parvibaculum sp. TaxID=291828 RepID=UPI0030D9868C
RPALFLDRDGVVVAERNYLSAPEDVALEDGAGDLMQWAREAKLALVCPTNQSGMARGRISLEALEAVEAEIARQLAERDAGFDLVIACPFHPDFTPDYGDEEARWRKPGPAMLELAEKMMEIDLKASWLIGDKASDIEAARNAGLKGAIHVLTGHGKAHREKAMSLATETFAVLPAVDLRDALPLLHDRL